MYEYKTCNVGRVLGQGAFGVVTKALYEETGEIVAVKSIKIIDASKSEIQNLERELQLLQLVNHKHIVRILGHQRDENTGMCNIIMEYVDGGSLSQMIQEFGVLSEHHTKLVCRQIIQGLIYLHSKCVVHRDIKPQNVLVDAKGVVKLADFGTAKHISSITRNTGLAGTPAYMSPELVRGRVSPACDIWAVGCCVLELMTGLRPWWHLGDPAMFALIYHIGAHHERPIVPDTCQMSDDARDFMNACLTIDSNFRPSAEDLLLHKWFKIETQPPVRNGKKFEPVKPDVLPSHTNLSAEFTVQSSAADAELDLTSLYTDPEGMWNTVTTVMEGTFKEPGGEEEWPPMMNMAEERTKRRSRKFHVDELSISQVTMEEVKELSFLQLKKQEQQSKSASFKNTREN